MEEKRGLAVSLPLPYDDFVSWAVGRYDYLGEGFQTEIVQWLMDRDSSLRTYFMVPRIGHETLEDLKAVFGGACNVPFEKPNRSNPYSFISDKAFFYIFKDLIKPFIKKALDEVLKPQWPVDVGLPRAERIVLLESIEKELSALVSERDSINQELSNAVA